MLRGEEEEQNGLKIESHAFHVTPQPANLLPTSKLTDMRPWVPVLTQIKVWYILRFFEPHVPIL